MITLPIEFLALGTEGFWDQLSYQLVGFFIVLITLTGLWIALEIIGSIFRSAERRRVATESAAAPVEVAGTAAPDPEMFAVIAAAIETVISQPHQIVSISPRSGGAKSTQTSWSSEGRKEIYQSHRLR